MKIEDVKDGMRVIPYQKTAGEPLKDCQAWKLAQEAGRNYLTVTHTDGDGRVWCGCALFNPRDLTPFDEDDEIELRPYTPEIVVPSQDVVPKKVATGIEVEKGDVVFMVPENNGPIEPVIAYKDSQGKLHETEEKAVEAETKRVFQAEFETIFPGKKFLFYSLWENRDKAQLLFEAVNDKLEELFGGE